MPPLIVPVHQYPASEVEKRQSPPRFGRSLDFTGVRELQGHAEPRFAL